MGVWAVVLYAALAMPFLAQVAPAVRLPMPALLAARSIPSVSLPTPCTSWPCGTSGSAIMKWRWKLGSNSGDVRLPWR
ncbi:MAG: hypothetical protein ABSF71_02945 [Terriglobia bacterium]